MKRIIPTALLGFILLRANLLITVPAYTLDKGTGYVGPSFKATIILQREVREGMIPDWSRYSISPTLWAGYGICNRLDASLRIQSIVLADDEFYLFPRIVLEGRYEAFARERFSLSPVLGLLYAYSPNDNERTPNHNFGINPELRASVNLSPLYVHAKLGGVVLIAEGMSGTGFMFVIMPEIQATDNLSFALEIPIFPKGTLTPAIGWQPLSWLTLEAECGIAVDLSCLSPGLAAYVIF